MIAESKVADLTDDRELLELLAAEAARYAARWWSSLSGDDQRSPNS